MRGVFMGIIWKTYAKLGIALKPMKNKTTSHLCITKKPINGLLTTISEQIDFYTLQCCDGIKKESGSFFRGKIKEVNRNGQFCFERTEPLWYKGQGIYYLDQIDQILKAEDGTFDLFFRSLYALCIAKGAFPLKGVSLFFLLNIDAVSIFSQRSRELGINHEINFHNDPTFLHESN